MGAKTLAPLAVVPDKSAKLGYMIADEERPLDVEPNVALRHLEKYMAERAALVSAHHHRELAAAQARNKPSPHASQALCVKLGWIVRCSSRCTCWFLAAKLECSVLTDSRARSIRGRYTRLHSVSEP